MSVLLKSVSTPNLRCGYFISGIKCHTNYKTSRKMSLDSSMSLKKRRNMVELSFLREASTQSIEYSNPRILTLSKEDKEEFANYFPEIVRSTTEDEEYLEVPEVMKRISTAFKYCVPHGKKYRGLATVFAYKMLEKPENLTTEKVKLANILGWCNELLHSAFKIADDVVDNSENRYGVPCWFRKKDVSLAAILDCIYIENSVYTILRKYFSSRNCYVPIIETFHDTTIKSGIGEFLDTLSTAEGKPRLEEYTMKRYKNIVRYKTSYYTLQLPVIVAMYLADIYDPKLHKKAKDILLDIGLLFQTQDDFLDCFGDPSSTGKQGTDIRDGKCSWLAVVALQEATPSQLKIMREHYGKPTEKSIQIIRHLYEDLHLPTIYKMHEEEQYNIIRTRIQQLSDLPRDLFIWTLESIYKRHH